MTRIMRLLAIAVALSWIACAAIHPAFADCCWFPLYGDGNYGDYGDGTPRRRRRQQDNLFQESTSSTTSSTTVIDDSELGDEELDLFDNQEFETLEERGDRSFSEPIQQAVIAWDGEKEVLVLSVQQESHLPGPGTVLSCLPMPGKPIDAWKADAELFQKVSEMIKQKTGRDPELPAVTPIFRRQIGAHSIFAVEATSTEEFVDSVQKYVREEFGGDAAALITSKARRVIGAYLKLGFRYFAFDLQKVSPGKKDKEAIAYHFESDRVFYPLVISQIGGTGPTTVNLAVITPGGLKRFRGYDPDKIQSAKPIPLSAEELRALDSKDSDTRIARMFPGGAKARLMQIRGNLEAFRNDVNAYEE